MGRASTSKKQKREARDADARKLRIVVCAYPDKSLVPVLEVLKAAAAFLWYRRQEAIVRLSAPPQARVADIASQLFPTQGTDDV